MDNEPKAPPTARPWHVSEKDKVTVLGPNEEGIAIDYDFVLRHETAAANAMLIVRSVNLHDDLVEALERLIEDWPDVPEGSLRLAEAALAKARGEP